MAIYKGRVATNSSDIFRLMEDEEFFVHKGWDFTEVLSNKEQEYLKFASIKVILSDLLCNQKRRKTALKIYRKEMSIIDKSLATLNPKDYKWGFENSYSIYSQEDQTAIRKLVLFLVAFGVKEQDVSRRIMNQLFSSARSLMHDQKEAKETMENLREYLDIPNSDMDYVERLMKGRIIENGILMLINEDIRKSMNYGHFLAFHIYAFTNGFIYPLDRAHLFIPDIADYNRLLGWTVAKTDQFMMIHYEKIVTDFVDEFDEESEEIATIEKIEKKVHSLQIGDVEINIVRNMTILDMLTTLQISTMGQSRRLLEDSAHESMKSYRKRAKILNRDTFATDLAKDGKRAIFENFDGEELDDILDVMKEASKYEMYEGEVARLHTGLLGDFQSFGGKVEELLYIPIQDKDWAVVNQEMKDLRRFIPIAEEEEVVEETLAWSRMRFSNDLHFIVQLLLVILFDRMEEIEKKK